MFPRLGAATYYVNDLQSGGGAVIRSVAARGGFEFLRAVYSCRDLSGGSGAPA